MSATPELLTTSQIGRFAAAVLAARLLYVWAAPPSAFRIEPLSAPDSSSSQPAANQPLIKQDPLLAAIALGEQGKITESQQALGDILAKGESAQARNALGVLYFRQKDNKKALEQFNKAVADDPKLAEAYSNRATVREALGDKAGEIGDYKKVVELKPAAPGELAFANAELKRLEAGPAEKSDHD